MLEKALSGDRRYWSWVAVLLMVIGVGGWFYLRQLHVGLGITGMSRDVSWGFYIAQFTFLVGVAASAVMVVLPYYLHDVKVFGKLTILGELLAISAVTMCLLFIVADLGQPQRMLNIVLHPTPHSILFWDMVVLNGYLLLNVVISRTTLLAQRRDEKPPSWVKPVVYLSILWAVSIHTVTAFIYSGLAARPFWLTAILAPRFLASAFSSGPALLILLCLILKRFTSFDPGEEAISKVAIIVTYAMAINVFFILMELFTAFYSDIPEHVEHVRYLFMGLEGHTRLVPWMWASVILAVISLLLLVNPATRRNPRTLALACVTVFASIWIDKGLGMVVAGFVPNPLGEITEYWPTLPEALISLGIYGIGALLVTGFYRIALAERGEVGRT
jgi:molybdopterin-containing oxidoreductase family membrane subunit